MEFGENPILHNLLERSRNFDRELEQLARAYEIPIGPRPDPDRLRCPLCDSPVECAVLVHAVGDCNGYGLDANGNFVWYGCTGCYLSWAVEIQTHLDRLKRWLPVPCSSCGRPIAEVAGVLLEMKPL